MVEDLGDWQRTHYSKQIKPEMDNQTVIVMGWVRELRDIKNIKFIKLADKEGFIQITAKKEEVKSPVLKKIEDIGREYVIAVKGTVRKNKEAPNDVEIIPQEIRILNSSEGPLPLEIETKKTPAHLPTRLDARFLDLRKPEVAAIFDVVDTIKRTFIQFFDEKGFININTPVIVSAATEGGAELFPVKYFDKEVYLNQSPQLYKQILMSSGFDKVTIITPVFRAEPHDTYRHLNEAVQLDIEVAFVRNEEDVLKYYDEYLKFAIEQIKKDCKESLKILKIDLKDIKTPIKRITYDQALEILKKNNLKIKWGDDIPPEGERILCKKFNPVIITKWPIDLRAFYAMPENEKVCRAYDLLYNGIEISSGAQRIHLYEELIDAMKRKGLKPKNFKFYLDAFKYGMPPHGGFSIGLERFTMALLKLSNIREATLFPRTKERVTP